VSASARRLRVGVVGGGPGGLWLAIRLLRDVGDGVEVVVYDASDDDSGRGLVLDADFLRRGLSAEPAAFTAALRRAQTWDAVTLMSTDGMRVRSGGHRITGVARSDMLTALRDAASDRGARLRPGRVDPRIVAAEHDLLVGADGAGSATRQVMGEFGTRIDQGRAMYLWMSTPCRLPAGFVLHTDPCGTFVGHTYPFEDGQNSFVVECRPGTLQRAGLDAADRLDVERDLARRFGPVLDGEPLRARTFPWRPFRTVFNDRWSVRRCVLLGDAAHTAHYSIGSGTALAIDDAEVLAASLASGSPVRAALRDFEAERREVVAAAQRDAVGSRLWFEEMDEHRRLAGTRLMFSLRTRRALNSYASLARRDSGFVHEVVRQVAGPTWREDRPLPPPRLLPLRLGPLRLPTRLVIPAGSGPAPPGLRHASPDGWPGPGSRSSAASADAPVAVLVRCSGGTGSDAELPAVTTADCVVLVPTGGCWREVAGQVAQRVRPDAAIGVLVPDQAVIDELARDDWTPGRPWDVVLAPAQPGSSRVERTELAYAAHRLGAPVWLWDTTLDPDEADTLIAAGRIDLCSVIAVDGQAGTGTPSAAATNARPSSVGTEIRTTPGTPRSRPALAVTEPAASRSSISSSSSTGTRRKLASESTGR